MAKSLANLYWVWLSHSVQAEVPSGLGSLALGLLGLHMCAHSMSQAGVAAAAPVMLFLRDNLQRLSLNK